MEYTHATSRMNHVDFPKGEVFNVVEIQDDMVVVSELYSGITRRLPIGMLELHTERPEKSDREKAIEWWRVLNPGLKRGVAMLAHDQKLILRPHVDWLTGREVEILWRDFVKKFA